MKPAPFIRHVPRTVEEAVGQLAEFAPQDGRILAGGQSLVPIMAFRMARPAHLIDINEVEGLDRLAVEATCSSIGARVRHAAFHKPVVDGPLGQLLSVRRAATSRIIRSACAARFAAASPMPIRRRNGAWSRRRSARRWSRKSVRGERMHRRRRFSSKASCRRRSRRTNCWPRCGCRCCRPTPNSASTNSAAAPAISPWPRRWSPTVSPTASIADARVGVGGAEAQPAPHRRGRGRC